MAIPSMDEVMLPVVGLVLNEAMHYKECVRRIADQFALTEEERNELVPSGKVTRIQDRVAWAVNHLSKAGIVERPRRGYVLATPLGRETLANHPERINLRGLPQFPMYREWRRGFSPPPTAEPVIVNGDVAVAQGTDERPPRERLDAAYSELNAALREEALLAIRNLSPEFFERIVISLLQAMGYGEAGTGQHLGKSGDGGVDGLIKQDPLGLDIIYLQAKRWESQVGAGAVRDFIGALDGLGADKGVFITTSNFARPAMEAADRSSKHIRLIDGEELTRLLVEYNVGVVQDGEPLVVKKIDENYFSE